MNNIFPHEHCMIVMKATPCEKNRLLAIGTPAKGRRPVTIVLLASSAYNMN